MVCEYLPSPRKSVQRGKIDKFTFDLKYKLLLICQQEKQC